ncbi:MAG: VCBS repeat-containing protein [Thermoplasmatota archaeon]
MKKIIGLICIILIGTTMVSTSGFPDAQTYSEKILKSTAEISYSSMGITWTKHIIENDINKASGIFPSDIDGDGDKDVVAAGSGSNEIAYWVNAGGSPIEWTKKSIDDDFTYPMDIFSCDIDADQDMDVIGAAWAQSEIALWKNSGGTTNKWAKQVIKSNYPGAHGVFACDIDGDGDMDVLGASANLNRIDLWIQEGGTPIVWTEQTIGSQYGGARSVYSIDIDNDGDMDVLGTALTDNEITLWYNEGGTPITWTEQTISDNFPAAHHVYAADIDNDGDNDVLGAAYGNRVTLWINEGDNPITWSKQNIDNMFAGAMRVIVADINDDGNPDIIASSSLGNNICWWSNDGNDPITWKKDTIDPMCTKAWPIYATDMDDDGDIDILGGSEAYDGIMWYENNLYPVESDLECTGSLVYTNIKPNSTITGQITMSNSGVPGSSLDWYITEYPEWGTWTFDPNHGVDLTPEDGEIDVQITIIAPEEKNQEHTGRVRIVNVYNTDDFCDIDISLSTPKNHETSYEIILIQKYILKRCPIVFELISNILEIRQGEDL